MGKPLDPREVEYCWLTKILFQFNVPVQDAQGNLAGYNHSAVMFYQLQDGDRALLKEDQEKISISMTDDPITIIDMVDIAKDVKSNKKMTEAINKFKKKKSGYGSE